VPSVDSTLNPAACSSFTGSTIQGLSLSLTETKAVPLRGSFTPPPSWLLAKARAKAGAMSASPSRFQSRPMTSPVERISGPSTVSTPAKRANGKTASLTAMWS
jgi:hypothetical protein